MHPKKNSSNNAREQAYKSLLKIDREGAFSNLEIRQTLSRLSFNAEDANLYTLLVYGVLQNQIFLDYCLDQLIKEPKRVDFETREILRIAAYQILKLDRIPDYAAVSEAVLLCGKVNRRAKGFVNGVLRNLIRNKTRLFDISNGSFRNEKEVLATRFSIPLPVVHYYFEAYGKEAAPAILAQMNVPAPLSVRVNTLKLSREDLAAKLQAEGLAVEVGQLSSDCLYLKGISASELVQSCWFKDGWLTIQDQGAMLIAELLDPRPGERILDMCAAPGGKTTHLAQLMSDAGEIIARDIYPSRLQLIEDAAKRLGISNIKTELWDGIQPPKEEAAFDKILLDAPCSGYGVIRRKPEIRYRGTKEDRRAIRQTQRTLLNNGLDLLRSDGKLVYATCTIDPEENNRQIARVVRERSDVIAEAETERMTSPLTDGCDGFYMIRLIKR
ncbi:ribosomal RNA small subunit methyltransferase B [Pseudoramibacter alactolyticus ATCC 23263]|uniref:16S rRNA (cytosine(967)-C(5))-methyltransferase n=1 Tax=Pseudoramibacter alactolyticus ATCC 23263 TaxID=887929 RepID=E6MFI6_9FIRM|nr:16S rRNA (cytosine(967)-C(5))-methyltransferase RsmB [Pseudoramibacter alactolyticus]EFV02173.1 ribosomal RNA small subunit methyltransferase B [Pseudoramibacter alactolyticus ATCC 23263]